MAEIKMLNHISDIKIEVVANSLEALYEESLRALSGLLGDLPHEDEEPTETLEFAWDKASKEEELIEFLSEALSISHWKNSLCLLGGIRLGKQRNEAVLRLFAADRFRRDIKAVTYHEASVEKLEEGGWRSVFLLDI